MQEEMQQQDPQGPQGPSRFYRVLSIMMATLLAIWTAAHQSVLLLIFTMAAIFEIVVVLTYSKKGRIPDPVAYGAIGSWFAWFLVCFLNGGGFFCRCQ